MDHRFRADHISGAETELRFFQAMQAPSYGAPRWYRGIRHATREEDLAGVDAFAFIDAGTVPIQIKSSHTGLYKDQRRYGNEHCVIIIPPLLTIEGIRKKTFNFLYQYRGFLLGIRTYAN